MNVSQLKAHVEANTTTEFFSKETMKFWGDTMRNYGVRSDTLEDGQEVWELYRKNPVKNGLQSSAYFAKGSFKRIIV